VPKFGTRHKEKKCEGIGIITNTNLGEIGSTAHDQFGGWVGQVTVKAEDVHEGSPLPCTRLGNQSSCLFVCYEEGTCVLN
jgi:hypothetical protein